MDSFSFEQLPSFNMLDLIIIGVMLYTVGRGVTRGMVRETLGIASVVGGYAIANLFYTLIEPGLQVVISSRTGSLAAAYTLTFLGAALSLALLFHIATRMMKLSTPYLIIDRMGGLFMGGLKGILVSSIILFVTSSVPQFEVLNDESAVRPFVLPVAEALGEEFQSALENVRDKPLVVPELP
ncbi:MAG: CvpA family protein [Leptospirillia bacterium]